jgi:hypothetical protein
VKTFNAISVVQFVIHFDVLHSRVQGDIIIADIRAAVHYLPSNLLVITNCFN